MKEFILTKKTYLLFVPALIVLLYNLILASPMYISESSFAIRNQGHSGADGLASAFFSIPSSSGNNSYILMEYATSIDIVNSIEKKNNILEHFSSSDHDFYSRLATDATDNDVLEYWKKHVHVDYDPDTAIISISARAYSPEMAQEVNKAVLAESEILINTLNERMQRDSLELANKEVAATEVELEGIQKKMFAYRTENKVVNPETEVGIYSNILGVLEGDLTKAKTELREGSGYLSNSSIKIVQLKSKIESLEQQIAEERKRLDEDKTKPNSLNAQIEDYENLKLKEEFARTRYVKALEALDMSKLTAQAQSNYIVPFRQPNLPDESLFPRPFEFALLTFIFTCLALGVLRMGYSIVMEHAAK